MEMHKKKNIYKLNFFLKNYFILCPQNRTLGHNGLMLQPNTLAIFVFILSPYAFEY